MRFGLFGSAQARRGGPESDSSEGFRDFIDYNVEAESLGFHSSFVVEHHFTGYGQVSATLNLLTWLGARTRRLRLGTAVMVLPWHNAEALERRLQNRLRQLKLATRPDGTVHGGPDRATGDPQTVNRKSAIYGNPDEVAAKLEELAGAGVGYVLLNGGGSGGGARGRDSLLRFAREIMPLFTPESPRAAAQ
jgi:alkanesulfonate monooxygenase SsuD/methylene tetrahydromethanopterin reductase-like flavin-dependent oxidoreductase (luciferase family)